MSTLTINEGDCVQFPMVNHAAEIGWERLTRADALARRGGESGVFLRDLLERKLTEFNPWLSSDAVRSIAETLDALPPTIEGNREMLSWMRGEHTWYDEPEERHRPVKLIDFEQVDLNAFHVTWEWTVKPPARKANRADVMFLVNGIPICIVEHKDPKLGNAIERAVTQLRRYEIETPELLAAPQLFNVTHLLDYWYADRAAFALDLAHKTQRLIEESATQEGLGRLTKSVTFDVKTLEALRSEKGSDEGKVFNLVRGLQGEIDENPAQAAVLQPLKDRAERILKDLEDRRTTGLAAMDQLAALAAEKDAAMKSARASGLSARAFGVYWSLRDDAAIRDAGLDIMTLARETDRLLVRFPNAAVNPEERRRLRAALYQLLLELPAEERARMVKLAMVSLVPEETE